jgi:hypothetical protein
MLYGRLPGLAAKQAAGKAQITRRTYSSLFHCQTTLKANPYCFPYNISAAAAAVHPFKLN